MLILCCYPLFQDITRKDGKANWLRGVILICLHAIVAVTCWYYPGSDPSGLLASWV
ncbi:hypothetical protein EI94DRAFT_1730318 [Lactarius quietus]|nr:hypothetical protein EI94DRAFT_1750293 [Lactarius quietus]KAF8267498.1 hypothetical protein EI94DRAFT_1730318 [Lactarius quietus]